MECENKTLEDNKKIVLLYVKYNKISNGIARLKSLGIAEKRINVGNSTYLSKLLKAKIGYSLKNKNDIYLLYIITNVAEIPKHIVGSLYKYKAKLWKYYDYSIIKVNDFYLSERTIIVDNSIIERGIACVYAEKKEKRGIYFILDIFDLKYKKYYLELGSTKGYNEIYNLGDTIYNYFLDNLHSCYMNHLIYLNLSYICYNYINYLDKLKKNIFNKTIAIFNKFNFSFMYLDKDIQLVSILLHDWRKSFVLKNLYKDFLLIFNAKEDLVDIDFATFFKCIKETHNKKLITIFRLSIIKLI
jgi:hypothetical protein